MTPVSIGSSLFYSQSEYGYNDNIRHFNANSCKFITFSYYNLKSMISKPTNLCYISLPLL